MNETKRIGDAIKRGLENGYDVKVFSKYNRNTDMYEECVEFNSELPAQTIIERYQQVENLEVEEIYISWPLTYDIVCK